MSSDLLRYLPTLAEDRWERLSLNCRSQASAPGVFFWSGEHVVLNGGIGVCQQVTLRVWVGLQYVSANADRAHFDMSDRVDDHLRCSYSPIDGKRQISNLTQADDKINEWPQVRDALRWLGEWATQQGMRGNYRLKSAHELPPGSGCNWSGAFANAISACVVQEASLQTLKSNLLPGPDVGWGKSPYRHSPKRTPGWSGEYAPELRSDWGPEDLNLLAWKFETILHKGRASGYGTLVSAVPVAGPVLYATGDRITQGIPFDLSENLASVNELNAMASSLLSSLHLDDSVLDDLPVAYGLISSGVPKSTGDSIIDTETIAEYLDTVVLPSVRATLVEVSFDHMVSQNRRLQEIANSHLTGKAMRDEQVRAIGTSSFIALKNLSDLLATVGHGKTKKEQLVHAELLTRAMRRNQGGLVQVGLEWSQGREIAEAIYRWARRSQFSDLTAVKMTGGGGGGQVLVMLPTEHSDAQEIESHLDSARTLFDYKLDKMRIEWLSTREDDRPEGRGLLVKHRPGDKGTLGGSETSM